MNRTVGAVVLLSLLLGLTVASRAEVGGADGFGSQGPAWSNGVVPGSPDQLDVTAAALAATVRVGGRNCSGLVLGSGFVIDGVLLTNRHLVPDARQAKVDRPVAPVFVDVVRRSDGLDLAVLEPVEALNLEFADGDAAVGDTVFLAGHGGGQDTQVVPAVVHLYANGESYGIPGPLLVLDGPSSLGFSGGPVLDVEGRVVGILQGYEPGLRLTLAIPASAVRSWLATGEGEVTGSATSCPDSTVREVPEEPSE